MPRKRKSKVSGLEHFADELIALDNQFDTSLRLPSLTADPPRLQGYSFKFTLVLPLMSESAEAVFTQDHLLHLHVLFCRRFGGFSATSGTSHPPVYGYYQPDPLSTPEKDFHTQFVVYAAPMDACNLFFARLKAILRTAPLQPQDEILIERVDAFLI